MTVGPFCFSWLPECLPSESGWLGRTATWQRRTVPQSRGNHTHLPSQLSPPPCITAQGWRVGGRGQGAVGYSGGGGGAEAGSTRKGLPSFPRAQSNPFCSSFPWKRHFSKLPILESHSPPDISSALRLQLVCLGHSRFSLPGDRRLPWTAWCRAVSPQPDGE